MIEKIPPKAKNIAIRGFANWDKEMPGRSYFEASMTDGSPDMPYVYEHGVFLIFDVDLDMVIDYYEWSPRRMLSGGGALPRPHESLWELSFVDYPGFDVAVDYIVDNDGCTVDEATDRNYHATHWQRDCRI